MLRCDVRWPMQDCSATRAQNPTQRREGQVVRGRPDPCRPQLVEQLDHGHLSRHAQVGTTTIRADHGDQHGGAHWWSNLGPGSGDAAGGEFQDQRGRDPRRRLGLRPGDLDEDVPAGADQMATPGQLGAPAEDGSVALIVSVCERSGQPAVASRRSPSCPAQGWCGVPASSPPARRGGSSGRLHGRFRSPGHSRRTLLD
jgi:hypothetical protein